MAFLTSRGLHVFISQAWLLPGPAALPRGFIKHQRVWMTPLQGSPASPAVHEGVTVIRISELTRPGGAHRAVSMNPLRQGQREE